MFSCLFSPGALTSILDAVALVTGTSVLNLLLVFDIKIKYHLMERASVICIRIH